jgi:hypothetical protein
MTSRDWRPQCPSSKTLIPVPPNVSSLNVSLMYLESAGASSRHYMF